MGTGPLPVRGSAWETGMGAVGPSVSSTAETVQELAGLVLPWG